MIQDLPCNAFKFEEDFNENMGYKEFKNYCVKLNGTGRGCVLEVDLEYSDMLHDSHDDFALYPEVAKINQMKYFKLICNTFDKEKHRIHYKMLLFVLEHGLKLKKIHRIVSFNEKKWLEPYIMKNTNLRKQAENYFEKDFYKLMNNSEFGKTMEDVKKYSDFRLEFDEKKVQKLTDNPRYKRGKIINNDLVQIEMRQTNIKFNKPIHIGFAVLELSKLHMYWFHYDVLKNKYGDKMKLIYIDTDGIKYLIEAENIFEDLKEDKEFATHVDFSNFPRQHYLFDEDNKGVIGKFKI